MNITDDPRGSRMSINTNTGLSIGVMVLIVTGVLVVMNGIGSLKSETAITQTQITSLRGEMAAQIASLRMEMNGRIDKVESKVIAIEGNKSAVTMADFFRWAVHLQQQNSDPKKLQTEGLKVPEPEGTTR